MPTIEKWTPLRELDLLDRRMRRFFEDLGVAPTPLPAADVYETDGELVVELEVPGFDEKELDVEVFDHTVAITGQRRNETESDGKTMRVRERLDSSFERRFQLPLEVDSKHIKAEYAKGILALHVPKATRAIPRKVEITKA
jgi:HSP20 family protein